MLTIVLWARAWVRTVLLLVALLSVLEKRLHGHQHILLLDGRTVPELQDVLKQRSEPVLVVKRQTRSARSVHGRLARPCVQQSQFAREQGLHQGANFHRNRRVRAIVTFQFEGL